MTATIFETLSTDIGQTWISDWLLVDQAIIDMFAEATGDRQFIHVDPVRAAETPFGGRIAHGFLTLSLIPTLTMMLDRRDPPDVKMVINYGLDSLRFLTPVRSGSRIRGVFTPTVVEEKRPGQIQETSTCTVEIEGSDKPALVATCLRQIFY